VLAVLRSGANANDLSVMTLVIDLRCLQDRRYYARGIGNHTRRLIRHAPAGWMGLYDPSLLPLPEAVAGLAARLEYFAFWAWLRRYDLFFPI
jgi:hypothetical protein